MVGYFIPSIKFHSVIDRPDSVSRVRPPIMTIPNTRDDVKRYQYPMTGFDLLIVPIGIVNFLLVCLMKLRDERWDNGKEGLVAKNRCKSMFLGIEEIWN